MTKLKIQLEQRQADLSHRIENINQDFKQGRSADFGEQATETENDDVLRTIKVEAERELNQINHALAKIESGEYGRCSECGEKINEQRLNAIPYADLCVNCSK